MLLALLIGGANNGSKPSKRGCLGRLLILALIIVGVVLLFNMCSGSTSGAFLNDLLGGYTTTDTGLSSVDSNASADTPSSLTDTLGSLLGTYGSTTGQIAPVSGSSDVYRAHEPDRTVDASARDKFADTAGAESVTVMVYMCGTDLESKNGLATTDLQEMVSAPLGGNVRVIVETGGASRWQNSVIKSGTNQRFEVKQGGLATLDANVGKRSMVDPDTLADFIRFGAKNYVADRYILVLWDHGGGSLTAFGYDELYPGDSMSLDEIDEALKSGGVKFDIIGFDACLMATLETALVASQYGDYLIASEAVEPGTGWYYTNWLSELAADPSIDSLDLGKIILDDYIKMSGESNQTTLSMTDLAELGATVPAAFNAFSSSTSQLIAEDGFTTVADARSAARDFSTSSRINQIDLIHFADNLGTAESEALSTALRGAVKYNRNSTAISHANGLSIYFPYQSMSKVSAAIKTYDAIGLDRSYSDCIKSFASVAAGGQVATGSSDNPLGTLLGDSTGSLLGTLLGGTASAGDTASGATDTVSQLLDLFLSNRSVVTGDKDSSWVVTRRLSAAHFRAHQENGLLQSDAHSTKATCRRWCSRRSSGAGWSRPAGQNVYVDDGRAISTSARQHRRLRRGQRDLIMAYDGKFRLSLNGQIVAYYLVSEDQVDEKLHDPLAA
ncbi:MAG: clostripain-related cysteine peptidase [Eubacteriales bacterium]